MSATEKRGQERGNPTPAERSREVPVIVPDVPESAASAPATVEEARTRRLTLGVVVVLVGVLIAVGIPAFGVWNVLLKPETDVPAGRPVQIEVPAGADTKTIAGILSSAGVIDNSSMFRVRSRIDGVDGKLRPGVYDLKTGMSFGDVVDQLLSGPPIPYVKVIIPEGFTIEQIGARLEKELGISAAEFNDLALKQGAAFAGEYAFLGGVRTGSLEGYLFPKTYNIPEGSSARDVIAMMLTQFGQEIEAVDLADASAKNLTLHDVVTIASMIEREARVADERPLVSSVIYNRLGRTMHLEIDATIEYILPGTRPRLLNRHLRIDSPYNTYMYGGLPPGPIASPGLASLEAAAHPADTGYLYYVLTSTDGSHTFTTNEADFLKAKEKSREVVP
ncbi:MAG: endolytic transglycosylase MltG [Actinobacteria bacterium]|nr:MAG: endolytic transglycosylase MltG [Actinomycetota bacterium]